MGGFLSNLKKIFLEPPGSGSKFITFYIKCDRCGEEIEAKASKSSDISRLYEGDGIDGADYILRKGIVGGKCNNIIHITIYFGSGYSISSKEIKGGKFI